MSKIWARKLLGLIFTQVKRVVFEGNRWVLNGVGGFRKRVSGGLQQPKESDRIAGNRR